MQYIPLLCISTKHAIVSAACNRIRFNCSIQGIQLQGLHTRDCNVRNEYKILHCKGSVQYITLLCFSTRHAIVRALHKIFNCECFVKEMTLYSFHKRRYSIVIVQYSIVNAPSKKFNCNDST